ncbi:hypothetical protein RRF57_003965 [Xylaria bambusicola]|uniref:Uncharacterized protein n=1 Tax=Xylaria bambusicola TaxID=326684 RepID=A0AAN7YWR1_9PEZI
MLPPAAPALTTVRGFALTPVVTPMVSGDEDSDCCATPPLSARRSRRHRIDDVVSANCSPLLRGAQSPAMSGIAKLRTQFEPLSLNDSPTSTMTRTRSNSRPRYTSSTTG